MTKCFQVSGFAENRHLSWWGSGGSKLWITLLIGILGLSGVEPWRQWTWDTDSPGPRAGHSFLLWNNKLFIFGGRSQDVTVAHDPKTYEIERFDGVLEFTVYDRRSVIVCSDIDPDCQDTAIGKMHNDLWEYDLSKLHGVLVGLTPYPRLHSM
jgi:hypothetical protein